MRTFIAIDLDLPARQQLAKYATTLRQHLTTQPLRWSPTENIHLTLQFLGEISTTQADLLLAALPQVAANHAPFRLSFGGVGGFPKLKQPRVVWVGLAGDAPALMRLQAAVAAAGDQLGHPLEKRPYRPHLTLARAKDGANPTQLATIGQALATAPPPPTAAWQIKTLTFYQSVLGANGARYTELGRWALIPTN